MGSGAFSRGAGARGAHARVESASGADEATRAALSCRAVRRRYGVDFNPMAAACPIVVVAHHARADKSPVFDHHLASASLRAFGDIRPRPDRIRGRFRRAAAFDAATAADMALRLPIVLPRRRVGRRRPPRRERALTSLTAAGALRGGRRRRILLCRLIEDDFPAIYAILATVRSRAALPLRQRASGRQRGGDGTTAARVSLQPEFPKMSRARRQASPRRRLSTRCSATAGTCCGTTISPALPPRHLPAAGGRRPSEPLSALR